MSAGQEQGRAIFAKDEGSEWSRQQEAVQLNGLVWALGQDDRGQASQSLRRLAAQVPGKTGKVPWKGHGRLLKLSSLSGKVLPKPAGELQIPCMLTCNYREK